MKQANGILSVIKFIAGVFLLPVVIGVTFGLREQFAKSGELYVYFIGGVYAYTVFHLFIFTPQALYQAGQRVFADIFGFFPALSTVVPLAVPILPAIILFVLYICATLCKLNGVVNYFMSALGFAFALHIILTAQDIYEEDKGKFKSRYLFSMSLVYIMNTVVISYLVWINFPKLNFSVFFFASVKTMRGIYSLVTGGILF